MKKYEIQIINCEPGNENIKYKSLIQSQVMKNEKISKSSIDEPGNESMKYKSSIVSQVMKI